MDIKKLYKDVCMLAGEIRLCEFLTYCDICARSLIATFGDKYVTGEGEYISPNSLEDSFAVDSSYYNAVLLYILSAVQKSDEKRILGQAEAQKAYLSIWKKSNGKRCIKGAKW